MSDNCERQSVDKAKLGWTYKLIFKFKSPHNPENVEKVLTTEKTEHRNIEYIFQHNGGKGRGKNTVKHTSTVEGTVSGTRKFGGHSIDWGAKLKTSMNSCDPKEAVYEEINEP